MIWENTLSGMVDSTAYRFDESTQYKKSDYVWYAATGVKPKLYKAKVDMEAGAWDASKWDEISVSTEFTNKDAIKTKNKTTYGAVEFDGNDLVIKRGKCYSYYTTDKTKTYHYGDFISGYKPPEDAEEFVIPATIGFGFFLPWDDPDAEYDYESALNSTFNNIFIENDDGELVINPEGDLSQVPEGFLTSQYDSDEDAYVPYKIHQNGTFEKLSPDIIAHSLTVEEFQNKGYSVGDFVFADGNLIQGGENWEPITGIQYVEPSPVKTTVMDLVTLQDEIAPTWEELNDKHYGALFYYNYELYALMGIDEKYDIQYSHEDTALFPNMRHLTELGEHIWANKITTLESLNELGTRQNGYSASHALIFLLFSPEATLKVLLPQDSCAKINGGLNEISSSRVSIDVTAEKKYITIDWDLHGGSVKFILYANEDELWAHDSLVENFNIRNGEVVFDEWRFPDMEYGDEPYYCLADNFHAENVTMEIETECENMTYGLYGATFKNSVVNYINTGGADKPRKCYIQNINLENSSLLIGKTTIYDSTHFEDVGFSGVDAKNSDITLYFRHLKEFECDLTNCTVKISPDYMYDDVFEDPYFIIDGTAKYCDIHIGSTTGGSSYDGIAYKGKQIFSASNSKYNSVFLDHTGLQDVNLPTMFGGSGGRHVGNVLNTIDGLKWHDFPTT